MRISKKGPQTREQILKIAIELLSKNGFANTTFQMIAEKCDISQALIVYHFPSKKELVREAIKIIVGKNHALVSSAMKVEMNALERLRTHFSKNLSWALENREEAQVILLLYYFASFDRTFKEIYEAILQGARSSIQGYLLAGRRERVFYFKGDGESLSHLLHDALLGGIVNAIATHAPKGNASRIEANWEILIKSLLKR